MSFQDLFEAGDRVGAYLKDLLTFYLAPGAYLRSVAQETGGKTAFRLAVYAVLFTLLEVSMFSVVVRQMPTGPFFLAGTTILELGLSVFYIPAFLLVTKFLKSESPAKVAVYALTYRFAYFLVLILLYVVFLLTEDYGLALLRGFGTYLFLLAYYLMLPLTLAQGVRKRALASAISVVACIVTFNAMAAIFELASTSSSRAAEMNILFDPIGAEVDRARIGFNEEPGLQGAVQEIRFLVEGKDSLTPTPRQEVRQRLATFREQWPRTDSTVRESLDRTDQRLKVLSDSATFHTTKDLIALRRAYLRPSQDVVSAIEDYVKKPTSGTYIPVLRADNHLLTTETVGLRRYSEHLLVRVKLIKLGFLINFSPDSTDVFH